VPPIALTDQQFAQVMTTSYTIPRQLRANYLRRAGLLRDRDFGDGKTCQSDNHFGATGPSSAGVSRPVVSIRLRGASCSDSITLRRSHASTTLRRHSTTLRRRFNVCNS
jgi:hypothetical protein